jgi:hypothetical protein
VVAAEWAKAQVDEVLEGLIRSHRSLFVMGGRCGGPPDPDVARPHPAAKPPTRISVPGAKGHDTAQVHSIIPVTSRGRRDLRVTSDTRPRPVGPALGPTPA